MNDNNKIHKHIWEVVRENHLVQIGFGFWDEVQYFEVCQSCYSIRAPQLTTTLANQRTRIAKQ